MKCPKFQCNACKKYKTRAAFDSLGNAHIRCPTCRHCRKMDIEPVNPASITSILPMKEPGWFCWKIEFAFGPPITGCRKANTEEEVLKHLNKFLFRHNKRSLNEDWTIKPAPRPKAHYKPAQTRTGQFSGLDLWLTQMITEMHSSLDLHIRGG